MVTHRTSAALASVVLAPLLLTGCGSGIQAQTNQIYQPGPGISIRDGGVFALNALIVTDGEGNGTLVTSLSNQTSRPDRLVGVTVKNRGGVSLTTTIANRPVTLPSRAPVPLGETGEIRVKGRLLAGSFCTLTLTFRNAAPVVGHIPIVSQSTQFAGIPVGSAAP